MSCHIPLEELRRLQRRSAEIGETLVTPPAPLEDEAGALVGAAATPDGPVAEAAADGGPAVGSGTDDAPSARVRGPLSGPSGATCRRS